MKTCDAQMCQGNPLKPNAYNSCGGPDDRVMGDTSRVLRFASNTTYFVFSNGVGVKEFHKPTTGGALLFVAHKCVRPDWPTEYRINIPGASNDWAISCPGCSANPSVDACRLISGCCKCCAKPNPCAVM